MALFGDLAVRLVRPADLGGDDRAHWAGLTERAGDINIFAHHWFMGAALRHAGPGQLIWLAIVERAGGEWIGVVPLLQRDRCGRWPTPNWQSWLATNQFLGAPLVEPECAVQFWDLLLRFLDGRAGREMFLQCRELAWDGPVCSALVAHCGQNGRKLHIVRQWDRPAQFTGSPVGAAKGSASGKALGRIKSLERRLEREVGPASVDFFDSSSCANQWIDDFLLLERSGWKGRGGSALACDTATEGLFRDVMREARERGHLRCATLRVEGRILAMSSWLVAGNRSYGFKMAYDEQYRVYAPGQLLMRRVADHFEALPEQMFDSCAPAGKGANRAIWADTRTIVDCSVGIGTPLRRLAFAGVMATKAVYRSVTAR